MMNKKFSFDAQGIKDWQEEVYALGQAGIDAECLLISTDFVEWMIVRFYLTADQISFIQGLGMYTQLSYATSLQDALQLQGEITLEKGEAPANFATVKNPKIVFKEQQNASRTTSTSGRWTSDGSETVQTVKLHFRIAYLEE